ncbi:MAG: 50S ribosomal protein L19 [Candidatus Daviesbacteria bacterium]|nr:50S ribosomal protein L19 [Candidatus Daviesbacteria bacterium]
MISAKVKDTQLHVGDTIRVHTTVVEGAKTRVQVFEGILIALRGRGVNQMMTVRRVSSGGIGVERMWPLDSKALVKIEVKKKAGPIRRSKLYYLRNLTGKSAVRV